MAASAGASAQPPFDDLAKASQERLREIFTLCDKNGNGRIDKRELIKVCRSMPAIAHFFGLPDHIRQEDGSRSLVESWFQQVDANDDREISWDEFVAFYKRSAGSATPSQPNGGRGQPARSLYALTNGGAPGSGSSLGGTGGRGHAVPPSPQWTAQSLRPRAFSGSEASLGISAAAPSAPSGPPRAAALGSADLAGHLGGQLVAPWAGSGAAGAEALGLSLGVAPASTARPGHPDAATRQAWREEEGRRQRAVPWEPASEASAYPASRLFSEKWSLRSPEDAASRTAAYYSMHFERDEISRTERALREFRFPSSQRVF